VRTSDFDYNLPKHLIAQSPAEPRDHSRLLVLFRETGAMEHRRFYELGDYLESGDVLVFNDSRVIPARLYGRLAGTGGKVELLLLQRLQPGVWKALGRPGRRLKPGASIEVEEAPGFSLEVLEVLEGGIRLVRLSTEEGIEKAGRVPLPPYIVTPLEDPTRYQTVYARVPGSVAAPTAGLHFTPQLLDGLRAKGVRLCFVTLHIGLDTFRPVQSEDPREHRLYSEYFELGEEVSRELNAALKERRRIIAVGTTSVRLLEQVALAAEREGDMELRPTSGWADLFILPGHTFRMVKGMVTNFHLPRSTVLMLVCAFAGRELIMKAYEEAIRLGYRFYTFGDAMLVL
jgi:S-adenosylmethionine:tRNA ribosyltransferase-isomerase